uniref:Uncharacterized protein n=1 Tax=Aureoumbra lagunensis TaxID=44058 RepID=A0A7S3K2B4_9STRA|mmetsp:Transcript_11952/g.17911  ORF Transcript_11952/g.17911 Transcript_11952/m.17911 type:complete len:428 (+) Transcript_11952:45-1328(+)|eukprot:CAMPEP_0197316540 /NCGR_PEP_ID=MMETSP0891-20130614/42997_1 /TAXON_ID=44058 ORGANISM="Aureoumbra lagunensis, Strain CCMP1510" /NCGR_SAMPLE_ID=MMETSP0891 /ASSEMBLY_ACC=CAM_ASM_000534 /LENGTH=427 /DNA_ID=CAMNT_0042806045 /DNA_START=12 /DNA_END=1295 /DNA_ORIENTATION=+
MSFEEAKQFLRREDESGSSLYEHLSKVLMKIIIEKPANANAMFEQLSAELRTNVTEKSSMTRSRPEKSDQLAWCQTVAKLYENENEIEETATFPDLMTEANIWEWAGINLGKNETYRLYLSLKAKALSEGIKIRFWGKIQTYNGDYLIAQADHPEPPETSLEIEGIQGTNKYIFWVCKHAGDTWEKLPDVTPSAITTARQIKKFFTGNLSAPVNSYPPFPGSTEAHLLRAQIALITADCCVSPVGYYVEDEAAAEDGIKAIQKAEEIEEFKSAQELKDPANWTHHELAINLNGRCNQLPPPDDEDEDNTPATSEDLPDLPVLATLDSDQIGWKFYPAPGGAGESPDSIIIVKSLKWPGAIAAAFGNKFLNVYCGWGFPTLQGRSYQPPPVPPIQTEWTPKEEEDEELIENEDIIIQPPVEEDEEEDA